MATSIVDRVAEIITANSKATPHELAKQITRLFIRPITTPGRGEESLRDWELVGNAPERPPVHVEKLPDDPICLRASIGGTAKDGYYLNYRGDDADIRAMLYVCLDAFERREK